MKTPFKTFRYSILLMFFYISINAVAQRAALNNIPITMTITTHSKSGTNVQSIRSNDIVVTSDKQNWKVESLEPVKSRTVVLIIDDSLGEPITSRLNDVRDFIRKLPANTQVMVSYAHNGIAETVQPLTSDLNKAAGSIRIPIGTDTTMGIYDAVNDLINQTKFADSTVDVVLITDGIDRMTSWGFTSGDLDYVVHSAQKMGVNIYTLYVHGEGHLGHSFFRTANGMTALSDLANATGGDSYPESMIDPVSYASYFNEIYNDILHQYKATILVPNPDKEEFARVRVSTSVAGVELDAPNGVFISSKNASNHIKR